MAHGTITQEDVSRNLRIHAALTVLGTFALGFGVGTGSGMYAVVGLVLVGISGWQLTEWMRWAKK